MSASDSALTMTVEDLTYLKFLGHANEKQVRELIDRVLVADAALDFIADVLDGTEWSADTLDVICNVVQGTGRVVNGE